MQSKSRDQDLIELGESRNKIEIAKNLLDMKMSIEDVSKGTGLSIEEVEKLVGKRRMRNRG